MQKSGSAAVVVGPQTRPLGGVRVRSEPSVWSKVRRERWMYALVLPGFLFFVVFRYLPLLGNVVAFEDYSPYLGFSTVRGSASTTLRPYSPIQPSPARWSTR
jgi:hypothetical protein